MEVGNYINIFPISFYDKTANVMITNRSKYSDLCTFREKINPTRVYALDDNIYGYGPEIEKLEKYGFVNETIILEDNPKFTSRLITEGIIDFFNSRGYNANFKKCRYIIIDQKNPITTSIQEVILLRGFEYRTMFFRSAVSGDLIFGLIIDLKYRTLWENEPCNIWKIKYNCQNKYGFEKGESIIREMKVKMGDLTPSFRRNSEAAKKRFNEIVDFVKEINTIKLPTGNSIEVHNEPIHVVIETEEENHDWW